MAVPPLLPMIPVLAMSLALPCGQRLDEVDLLVEVQHPHLLLEVLSLQPVCPPVNEQPEHGEATGYLPGFAFEKPCAFRLAAKNSFMNSVMSSCPAVACSSPSV